MGGGRVCKALKNALDLAEDVELSVTLRALAF